MFWQVLGGIKLLLLGILFLITRMFIWILDTCHIKASDRTFRGSLFIFTRSLLWCCGVVRIKVTGHVHPHAKILVANHMSFMDPLVVLATTRGKAVSFVSKRNVKGIAHGIFKYLDFIFVDRNCAQSRKQCIEKIKHRALDKKCKMPILIFPEGTTSFGKEILPFKLGAFAPLQMVQPIAISYQWPWDYESPHLGFCVDSSQPGRSSFQSIWRTLCLPWITCHVHYLPLQYPEITQNMDVNLFASKTRALIAETLHLPLKNVDQLVVE
jgi:1-acyl-sn-glycerol-3-phosphate acyltransferase